MMKTKRRASPLLGAAFALAFGPTADAQSPESVPTPSASPTATAMPASGAVPAGTTLVLRLETPLNSKTATTGQLVAMTVAQAVVRDGREVIPAGTAVEGEVTHAAKASWGGKPGELMLAARRLKLPSATVRLRSNLGVVGSSTTTEAIVLSNLTFGLGTFLSGGEIDLPAGVFLAARTAEAFTPPTAVPSAVAPVPTESPQP